MRATVMILGLWLGVAIPLATWAERTFFHRLGISALNLPFFEIPQATAILVGTTFGFLSVAALLFAPTLFTLYTYRHAPSERASDLPNYESALGSCAKWLAAQAVIAGILLIVALLRFPSILPIVIGIPVIGTFALSMHFRKDFFLATIETMVAFSIWWFSVWTFAPLLVFGSTVSATTASAGLFGAVVLPYAAAMLIPQPQKWHQTLSSLLIAAAITSVPWVILAATLETVRLHRVYFVASALGAFSREPVEVRTATLIAGHEMDFSSTPIGGGMSRLNPSLLTTLGNLRVACSQQRPFIFPVTMQPVQQRCVVIRDGEAVAAVQYPTR
jgi:hypothetical protein